MAWYDDYIMDKFIYGPEIAQLPTIEQPEEQPWYANLTPVKAQDSGYVPQNGDIVEINSDKNKKYGHTATFYNGKWYSDFEQKEMNPYNDPNAKIRIFRNKDSKLANLAAAITASRAGKHSKHRCARSVREGLDMASGGMYKGQGYNGNNFGDYLQQKEGWTQVAQQGMKFAKYEPIYVETQTSVKPYVSNFYPIRKVKWQTTSQQTPILQQNTVTNRLTPVTKSSKKASSKRSFSVGRPDNDAFITNTYNLYKQQGLGDSAALLMAAQDALESGYGRSQSGKNNISGIKGKGTKRTTKEGINGNVVVQEFADYNSPQEAAAAKIKLLNSSKYNAFSDDIAENILNRIIKGGYQTGNKKKYYDDIMSIYNMYNK